MADAVTSQTLHDTDRILVRKFTNLSDGSGETTVTKVDVSTLAVNTRSKDTCTRVAIERLWYATAGMTVDILWDATSNVCAWTAAGHGYFDFRSIGPLTNDAGTGINGDILFTTVDATVGDRYSIMIEMRKIF